MTTSDQITKQELTNIILPIKEKYPELEIRIFSEGSDQDQKIFEDGGCTFVHAGKKYGSCDAVLIYKDLIIAIEMTDALNRGSSGSAQIQRFHHALGAVKKGYLGIYYLRHGKNTVQPVLYGMAVNCSKYSNGKYLITQDLKIVIRLIEEYAKSKKDYNSYLRDLISKMKEKFDLAFTKNYKDSWENFAEQRSLIIHDKYILKYVSSNYESFTVSSKRAGHITLGEFFLGRYLLEDLLLNKKKYIFLLPRLTAADLKKLNEVKNEDKEWLLMNNEPNSSIKTIDDLTGLPKNLYATIQSIKTKPMTNGTLARKKYNKCMNKIVKWLKKNKFNFN
jgi:hypothetical protein